MIHLLLVALGGAIGAGARHLVNVAMMRPVAATGFPVATLFVNIIGSFIMGLAAGYFAFRGEGGMELRLFLMTGILGGFTTFSAFSLETVLLFEREQYGLATLYVGISVAGSVAGLVAGLALVRGLQ